MARRPWRIGVEVGFVALVLLLWQLARIPLEGGREVSLEHAASWLDVEQAVRLDHEAAFVDFVDRAGLYDLLDLLYGNMHVPVLFGFMAAARLFAPARYPLVRTTYALSFLPALVVIGMYPLAPPHWLAQFGGTPPSDEALTGSLDALFENSTAAAASQHFGFAALVAIASLWLWPRSPLALFALAYPPLVFFVIVGAAQHYVLDCVVGMLTVGAAALAASRLHQGVSVHEPAPPRWSLALTAVGYALLAWSIETLHDDPGGALATAAVPGLLGLGAVAAGPWLQGRGFGTRERWHDIGPSGEEVGT